MIDMTGRVCGLLTVLGLDERRKGKIAWRCRCACGRELRSVPGEHLRIGDKTRCDECALRNKIEVTIKRSTKHGANCRGRRKTEYTSWVEMKARCLNPSHSRFADWGGRGITIHPEWVDSFEAFYAYVGPKPSRQHTIDRKDNNVGYVPGNVRWATSTEQNRNNRRVWRIPLGGDVLSASEVAERLGVQVRTLRRWLGDGRTPKTGPAMRSYLEAAIIRALGKLKGAEEIERLRKLGCVETKPRVELRATRR